MSDRHVLPGSHHPSHPDHQPHSKCHPYDQVDVTLWTTPGQCGEAIVDFGQRHGLVCITHGHPNAYRIAGCVETMEHAFGVELHHLHHPDGNLYRGHLGPISVPIGLKDIVTGVFGLDQRPVAKPHKRTWRNGHGLPMHASGVPVAAGTFTPPQLAKLYGFPEGSGSGQTIGLIELGGGYRPKDLVRYFHALGMLPPVVESISVDGGRNAADGNPDGADGEVMSDIEVAGSIAYGAKILVLFADNTDQGFMNAAARAIGLADIVSISWGGPESQWTASAMQHFDMVLAGAVAAKTTVLVASGDNGSSDGVDDGANHVDFPASSPHVLAVGGTSVVASNGVITSEVVWNDGPDGGSGGGGFSSIFDQPDYQKGIDDTASPYMRGVPDVSANADPETGYVVLVDGQWTVIGGTSLSTPLWAALIAICNGINGTRAGDIHAVLYANPAACNDIVSGNNGAYQAGPGWDAPSGLGSPKGAAILAALKGQS